MGDSPAEQVVVDIWVARALSVRISAPNPTLPVNSVRHGSFGFDTEGLILHFAFCILKMTRHNLCGNESAAT